MKRLWSLTLAVCLIMINVVAIFNPINAEEKNSILDNVKLVNQKNIEDKDKKDVESHVWNKSESMVLVYEWSLKNHKNGYTEKIAIPKELKIDHDKKVDILTEDKSIIGEATISKDNELTLNIDDKIDYINNNADIRGTVSIEALLNNDVANKNGTYKLDFGLTSETYDVEVAGFASDKRSESQNDDTSKTSTWKSGSVTLTVTEKDDKNIISGSVYNLYNDNGEIIKEGLISDSTGSIIVRNLSAGFYYFEQVKAAPGYEVNTDIVFFEIVESSLQSLYIGHTNTKDGYVDPNKGSVILVAVDSNSDYNIVGVEYKLQDQYGYTLDEKLITDKNGKILVTNLEPGKYSFVQTKVPNGYKLENKQYDFEIKKAETTVVKAITNKDGASTSSSNNNANTTNNKTTKLPQTGGLFGNTVTIFVGLTLVGVGTYLVRSKNA